MSDGGNGPNPGSDEAIAKGCECPVIDNAHGKGVMGSGEHRGWWINSQCPLHGEFREAQWRGLSV